MRDGIVDRNPARISGWQHEYQRIEDELDEHELDDRDLDDREHDLDPDDRDDLGGFDDADDAPRERRPFRPGRGGFDAEAAALGLTVQPPVGTGLDGAVLLAEHLAAGRELTGHAAYLKRG